MKSIATVTCLAVCAVVTATATAASLYPRFDWRPGGGHVTSLQPPCGGELSRDLAFAQASRVTVLEPNVGDLVTNYFTRATWGRITDLTVRKRNGLTAGSLRIAVTGEEAACGIGSPPKDIYETGGTTYVSLALWRPLPSGWRRFHAWTPDGQPAIRVRGRQHGTCDQSWLNRRDDAWRCITQRYVLDPCFSAPIERDRLVCPLSPWRREGWIVRGTGFDTWKARRPVWGLRTANRRRCSFLSGAGAPIRQGRRLNYGCSRSGRAIPPGRAGYLWGVPKRRNGRLMIPYSREYDQPWRWVRVTERWN
jgi:hypothetical protein